MFNYSMGGSFSSARVTLNLYVVYPRNIALWITSGQAAVQAVWRVGLVGVTDGWMEG